MLPSPLLTIRPPPLDHVNKLRHHCKVPASRRSDLIPIDRNVLFTSPEYTTDTSTKRKVVLPAVALVFGARLLAATDLLHGDCVRHTGGQLHYRQQHQRQRTGHGAVR